MPTPPKPYSVIAGEGRSHRTKAEMQGRKEAEEASLTGEKIKMSAEVKDSPAAKKMYKRITELLEKIEKNDAIYENVINRYCLMHVECEELKSRIDAQYEMIGELKMKFSEFLKNERLEQDKKANMAYDFAMAMAKLTAAANATDKLLQAKRKMLLDIEKENIMTVAAALRSIPKRETKEENPLKKILGG